MSLLSLSPPPPRPLLRCSPERRSPSALPPPSSPGSKALSSASLRRRLLPRQWEESPSSRVGGAGKSRPPPQFHCPSILLPSPQMYVFQVTSQLPTPAKPRRGSAETAPPKSAAQHLSPPRPGSPRAHLTAGGEGQGERAGAFPSPTRLARLQTARKSGKLSVPLFPEQTLET